MTSPTRSTIDNLPPSTSQRYATDELKRAASPLYQDISQASSTSAAQVAVLLPSLVSHLEELTGSLGQVNSQALYSAPNIDFGSSLFTYALLPSYFEKDKAQVLQKLASIKNNPEQADPNQVSTLEAALKLVSYLNQCLSDVYLRCRQFKQG